MKSTTTGQHSFATVPRAEIQRSSFNRSSGLKTTFNAGDLVPIFADEALPGDTFNLKMHSFGRFATLLYPTMDNVTMDTFFFAVPIRLIWENWERMMGDQTNPGDSTDFLVPQITSEGGVTGDLKLSDYLGIPTHAGDITHSSLWHRAYNLIWNEWFRDENLQDRLVVDQDDGPDSMDDYDIVKRGKRHDYFTSCLPWPQKGDPVELPLGSSAPVTVTNIITGDGIPLFDVGGANSSLGNANGNNPAIWSAPGADNNTASWAVPNLASTGTGTADLSSATAATINQLREAFQIQRLYERDARGGSRYTEIVRSHFGVVSPDQRLQRPEYLGGGSQPITINQVESNSAANSGTVGTLSAYGTTQGSNNSFSKSFTEHCVIIGLVSVRADLSYQQGLPRMFSRRTRFDFYWPALSHIGEQAVLNKEIYAQGTDDPGTEDDAVFGYQERYAEYRYKPSQITGEMRSAYSFPLDAWHLAQNFTSLPTLGETFIEENPPVARIIANPSDADLLLDVYFDLKCVRPMPTYGTPGLIDHF